MILKRICQLTLTRITHQVSHTFDLNNVRSHLQILLILIVTTLIFYYVSIPHSFFRFLPFSVLCFFLVLLYSSEYAQFKRTFFVFSAIFQTKKAHGSLRFLPCTFKNYLSVLIFTRCILPCPLFSGISV